MTDLKGEDAVNARRLILQRIRNRDFSLDYLQSIFRDDDEPTGNEEQ